MSTLEAPEDPHFEENNTPRWKKIKDALEAQEIEIIQKILGEATVDDQRRIISRLSLDEREQLCKLLPIEETAQLFEHLIEEQATELLEEMPADVAADVIEELPADLSGDLLREIDEKNSTAILAEIDDSEESAELLERSKFAWDCAGGLMSDRVVSFPETTTVQEVLTDLGEHSEDYSDADVQYFYVVDSGQKLTGVLALRTLVLSKRNTAISDLMIQDPMSVSVDATLEELEDFFEEKNYLGFPVVDDQGKLRGLISRGDLNEALSDRQTEGYLKSSGIVGGEELRSMPLKDRCLRRLAWLGPNILLNLLAASVIAAHEETLQAVIALAIFLPMVSDMSGCSGNQAVAVSIRELTLGVIQPRDYMRVLFKEGLLGINNGIVLGIVLGVIAAIWKDSVYLGVVVGSALALNTILSVLLGGLIPLALKKLKVDPALASSPILTTCTDMCGFFLVLSVASLFLTQLT